MRRSDPSRGLVLCFFLNLVMNFEWGIITLVLWILHWTLDLTSLLGWLGLAAWIVFAILLTALTAWGNRCATLPPDSPKENRNPYSVAQNQVFPQTQAPAAPTLPDFYLALAPALSLIGVSDAGRRSLGERLADLPSPDAAQLLSLMAREQYLVFCNPLDGLTTIGQSLSLTAAKLDLAPVPPGLLQGTPPPPYPAPATRPEELLGLIAARYLASHLTLWRIFLVEAPEGQYLGLVRLENADALAQHWEKIFPGTEEKNRFPLAFLPAPEAPAPPAAP